MSKKIISLNGITHKNGVLIRTRKDVIDTISPLKTLLRRDLYEALSTYNHLILHDLMRRINYDIHVVGKDASVLPSYNLLVSFLSESHFVSDCGMDESLVKLGKSAEFVSNIINHSTLTVDDCKSNVYFLRQLLKNTEFTIDKMGVHSIGLLLQVNRCDKLFHIQIGALSRQDTIIYPVNDSEEYNSLCSVIDKFYAQYVADI
jgi:hypothetical protein